jgi:hypothetical protein
VAAEVERELPIRTLSVTAFLLRFGTRQITKEIAMPTPSKAPTCALAIAAALCVPLAPAAAAPAGALPGDQALTCEQIYAQVDAEMQRARLEREKKAEELRNQSRATKTLLITATLAGGLGGTGQAAQSAAEAQADKTMTLSAPPPDPRTEHLKQLWAQKHCVKK